MHHEYGRLTLATAGLLSFTAQDPIAFKSGPVTQKIHFWENENYKNKIIVYNLLQITDEVNVRFSVTECNDFWTYQHGRRREGHGNVPVMNASEQRQQSLPADIVGGATIGAVGDIAPPPHLAKVWGQRGQNTSSTYYANV